MVNKYTQEFKQASIGLLLNITQNTNTTKSNKYYKFFQKELNISENEFQEILEIQQFSQAHNIIYDNQVNIIRKELGDKKHSIMKFLMMLNRCIIIDGCDAKCYHRFEKIRNNFMKKL